MIATLEHVYHSGWKHLNAGQPKHVAQHAPRAIVAPHAPLVTAAMRVQPVATHVRPVTGEAVRAAIEARRELRGTADRPREIGAVAAAPAVLATTAEPQVVAAAPRVRIVEAVARRAVVHRGEEVTTTNT